MWASVVVEAASLVWPLVTADPMPVPGLRRFAVFPGGPAILASSLLVTLWLSVPRWHTRQRMIGFAWVAVPIGFIGSMVIGGFFGFPLCWAGSGAWRTAHQPPATS